VFDYVIHILLYSNIYSNFSVYIYYVIAQSVLFTILYCMYLSYIYYIILVTFIILI